MQVGINVTCMYTSFGGHDPSGFGDMATFQKWQNFPFCPWTLKNLINQNWLKKFMQVEIDVKCMHTDFSGCDPSSFGDMATFQKRPNFPFGAWKNSIDRNRLKKFMQVGVDVTCMYTSFGGRGLFSFGDKISLLSIKVENFNRSESTQKIYASRGRCHVHSQQFLWA